MKRFFLAALLFSSAVALFGQAGFFLDDWSPKSIEQPAFIDAEKPAQTADVTATINFTDTLARVSTYIYGNNANTWSTIMHNNDKLVNNIRNMNPHVLRYPGGNLSNSFFWDRKKDDRPDDIPEDIGPWYGMNKESWTMSVDDYYTLLEKTNSTGIISLNYSYARYGTSERPVEKAAHLAAEWVRYDNGRTSFWEIGNENYGNWQAGYTIDTSLNKDGQPEQISGRLYGEHCLVFIDSLRAAAAEIGHTIYIGVQAWESETSWDAVQTDWNEQMMPIVGGVTDYYIVHNYFTPYNENSNAKTILNTYKKPAEFKRAIYKDLADASFPPAPLALTEWNIFAVGSMQQVSHINGLLASMILGKLVEEGYGLAARWDLANGWNNGDDHGAFSQGGEPGVPKFSPRPVFYHMTFFQKYFGDVMVSTQVQGSRDIIVHASSFSNGPAGIFVANKSASEKTVLLNINNFAPGERYYWYTMVGDDDNGEFSRKVIVNGEGPSLPAGGPEDYETLPAFSALTDGGILLAAPAYSGIYILVDGEKTETGVAEKSDTVKNFVLGPAWPNPFNASVRIIVDGLMTGELSLDIYSIAGTKVRTLNAVPANRQSVLWDGRDDHGRPLPSGAYVIRAHGRTLKVLLLK